MKKCLLLGNGGREAVLAEQIAKGFELYAILPYANPSVVEQVEKTKGKYIIGDPFDKELVKKFITRRTNRFSKRTRTKNLWTNFKRSNA